MEGDIRITIVWFTTEFTLSGCGEVKIAIISQGKRWSGVVLRWSKRTYPGLIAINGERTNKQIWAWFVRILIWINKLWANITCNENISCTVRHKCCRTIITTTTNHADPVEMSITVYTSNKSIRRTQIALTIEIAICNTSEIEIWILTWNNIKSHIILIGPK